MKTTLIRATMGMLAALGTSTAQATHRVVVYVRQDNMTVMSLGRAQEGARKILAEAGVAVVFRGGPAPKQTKAGEVSLELQLDSRVPQQFHPGAFGYAAPYGTSGTRIHIFCDRVQRTTPDAGTGMILGYVLAHEIGHVLQGVARHSGDGVMKAHWDRSDYRRMMADEFPWDSADADLIQQFLASSTTRPVDPGSR